MAQLEPVFFVDTTLRHSTWYQYPVRLCFGFGLDSDLLVDYALKQNITDERALSEVTIGQQGRTHTRAVFEAQKRLKKVTRAARHHLRIPIHLEYGVALALYDNWSKEDEGMSEEHEKIVLDSLKKELGFSPDLAPMWYFEMEGY